MTVLLWVLVVLGVWYMAGRGQDAKMKALAAKADTARVALDTARTVVIQTQYKTKAGSSFTVQGCPNSCRSQVTVLSPLSDDCPCSIMPSAVKVKSSPFDCSVVTTAAARTADSSVATSRPFLAVTSSLKN